MTKTEIEEYFTLLIYKEDTREVPDNRRQGAFKIGWRDATLRNKKYSDKTLRQLIWQNLGYRYGQRFGNDLDVQSTYDVLAQKYEETQSGAKQFDD